MIKAPVFKQAFQAGFRPSAERCGLELEKSRWVLQRLDGNLSFEFSANPKASGIPYCPGHFFAFVHWMSPRRSKGDDGVVSYFQYTTAAELRQLQSLRSNVVDKTAAQSSFTKDLYRQMRDVNLRALRSSIGLPLKVNAPHAEFYYLDENDALMWGQWFGTHISPWLERFSKHPETLDAWLEKAAS